MRASAKTVCFAVAAQAIAACASASPARPDEQQLMIITAISGPGNPGGVAMMRLSFPSAASCAAAARVLEQDIRGGYVTARCIATH